MAYAKVAIYLRSGAVVRVEASEFRCKMNEDGTLTSYEYKPYDPRHRPLAIRLDQIDAVVQESFDETL